nr:FAD-binding oxidoreductase [Anaerolineae bacterium]
TIQQLWQYTLEDGWWPAVVPGTMTPTVGGCLAMNVHGKNNYRAGTFGDHVLEFTALLSNGERVTVTPGENADFFYSMIGSLGVLGVFTSITLQLKRIYSGNLSVEAWAPRDLAHQISALEARKDEDEYLVSWIDGTVNNTALGRGQIHAANYLKSGEDPAPQQTLRLEHQTLPDALMGVVPASILWRLMSPWMNNPGTRLINAGKYYASRLGDHKTIRQPHAAFHFLLDYIPNWVQSYGRQGLIQYQSIIPTENAVAAFNEMLHLTQKRGLPSYLVVLKRHRPDAFLLSHAVDGYSLAFDFKVTRNNRAELQHLANELNQIVLAASGRFYFAKDSTLTPKDSAQFLGAETLAKFKTLKNHYDPQNLLQTDLYNRLF